MEGDLEDEDVPGMVVQGLIAERLSVEGPHELNVNEDGRVLGDVPFLVPEAAVLEIA